MGKITFKLAAFVVLIGAYCFSYAQNSVGIGTDTPNSNAVLDLVSTNQGILVPRLSSVQIAGMTLGAVDEGLMVYDSTNTQFMYWTGAAWAMIGGDDADWTINGNLLYSANRSVGVLNNNPVSDFQIGPYFHFDTIIPPGGGNYAMISNNLTFNGAAWDYSIDGPGEVIYMGDAEFGVELHDFMNGGMSGNNTVARLTLDSNRLQVQTEAANATGIEIRTTGPNALLLERSITTGFPTAVAFESGSNHNLRLVAPNSSSQAYSITLPSNLPSTSGQVLSSDLSGNLFWSNNPQGDINNVTAGAGLIGGGATGSLTLTANANNGLNVDAAADRIQLGGALVETTTITHGVHTLTHDLNSSGNFAITDGATYRMMVENGGDVGLGLANPANHLTLYSTGAHYMQVTDDAAGSASGDGIRLGMDGAGAGYMIYGEFNNFHIGTSTDNNLIKIGGTSNTMAIGLQTGTLSANHLLQLNIPNTDADTETGLRVDNNSASGSTKYGGYFRTSADGTAEKIGARVDVYQPTGEASAARGFYSYVDHDGTGASYLYYGSSPGTTSGVEYGVYITGEDHNYFAGEVGIGTTNPTKKLHVIRSPTTQYDGAIVGSSTTTNNSGFFGAMAYDAGTTNYGVYAHSNAISNTSPLGVNRGADGALVNFSSAGIVEGQISVTGTTVSYGAFTGVHYAQSEEEDLERGMLVTLTGENGTMHDIEGSELVHGVKKATIANDPKTMGAFLGLITPQNEFSRENPYQIMAVGNGDMWVADNGQNLKPGDYLISSDVAGHAMLDNGEFDVSYVIARVSEPVDWNNVKEDVNGVKHKKIAVFFENFVINHKAERLEDELQDLKDKYESVMDELNYIKERLDIQVNK